MIYRPVGGAHEIGPTVGGGQEVKWSMFFSFSFYFHKDFHGGHDVSSSCNIIRIGVFRDS